MRSHGHGLLGRAETDAVCTGECCGTAGITALHWPPAWRNPTARKAGRLCPILWALTRRIEMGFFLTREWGFRCGGGRIGKGGMEMDRTRNEEFLLWGKVLACCCCYWSAMHGGWLWDDDTLLTQVSQSPPENSRKLSFFRIVTFINL